MLWDRLVDRSPGCAPHVELIEGPARRGGRGARRGRAAPRPLAHERGLLRAASSWPWASNASGTRSSRTSVASEEEIVPVAGAVLTHVRRRTPPARCCRSRATWPRMLQFGVMLAIAAIAYGVWPSRPGARSTARTRGGRGRAYAEPVMRRVGPPSVGSRHDPVHRPAPRRERRRHHGQVRRSARPVRRARIRGRAHRARERERRLRGRRRAIPEPR